jgi:phosphoribosyl 1,2-cyclic phosphate phosphodiesterase
MKITVLGSGSAYGVPFVGGGWGKCDPNNSRNRRTTPSILIEDKETKILVDMGPDFGIQSIKHNINLLDAVLYTHGHADHIAGNFHIPKLMYFYQDRNLPLYVTKETQKEIEMMWWFHHNPKINVEYSGPGRPYFKEIVPYEAFKISDLEILPLLQYHSKLQSVGFKIGNFAYSTDFKDMPEESFAHLHDLDVWLLECDSTEESTMHLHLERALMLIEKYKPKKAYLTHLNYMMDYDTITAMLPANVELAYDGLEIEIEI